MNKDAILPFKTFPDDAGYDLYSCDDATIQSGEFKLIKTGLMIVLSSDMQADIRSRSGLALKHGVVVLNSPGTIDPGYQGEIGVILCNHGRNSFHIAPGDPIAQLVFAKRVECRFVETEAESIGRTNRGSLGFGSG